MNLFSKIFKSEPKSPENKKKRTDLVPKLCCLFCALGLWLLVSGETDIQDEKTYNNVPVEIVGVLSEQSGLSVISDDDYVINITVRGNRAKLASCDISQIHATVDVSGITEVGSHALDVVVTPPSDSGFTVVEQSHSTIDVSVDKKISKTLKVEVDLLDSQYSDEYAVMPTVKPTEVTISGPEQLLNTITSASVELNLGKISTDVAFQDHHIALFDNDGKEVVSPYIIPQKRLASGTVRLVSKEEANKEITKDVSLECKYKYGYYNETNCFYTLSQKNVRLKGPKSVLDNINTLTAYVIDETEITSSTVLSVTVESPEGTIIEGENTVDITVIVSDKVALLEVPMNNVVFNELSQQLTAELDGAYILRLRGDSETLDNIQEMIDDGEYPKAYVDMSLVKSAGVYSLPVSVKFDSATNKVWCEAQKISVKVFLNSLF